MRAAANRRSLGFTLIEMMITVSIIGILAAIAIPAFQNFEYRSKRSEAMTNLSTIRKLELGYFTEVNAFLTCAPSPALPGPYPGTAKQNWQTTQPTFSKVPGTGFDQLGYSPEGAVYFDYNVRTGPGTMSAAAFGDLDGNGSSSVFLYVYPDPAGNVIANLLGYTVPFDPATCKPIVNAVAQVPPTGNCGYPNGDAY